MFISIIFNIIFGVCAVQMEDLLPPLNRESNHVTGEYTVRDVRGDGNCAFRALAVALGKNDNAMHAEYRALAVSTLRQNDEYFAAITMAIPALVADPDLNLNLKPSASADEYLTRMAQDGVYGGDIELGALAKHFHIRIQIWQGNTPVFVLNNTGPGAATRPLVNLNRVGAHYQAMIHNSAAAFVASGLGNIWFGSDSRQPKTKSTVGKLRLKTKSNFETGRFVRRSNDPLPMPAEARPVRNNVMIGSPRHQKTPRSRPARKTSSRFGRQTSSRKTSPRPVDHSLPVRRDAILSDLRDLAPVQSRQTVPTGRHSLTALTGKTAYGSKKIVTFSKPVKYNFFHDFPAGVEVQLQHLPPKKGKQQFKILAVSPYSDEDLSSWVGYVLTGPVVEAAFRLSASQRAPTFAIGEGVEYHNLRNGQVDAVLREESSSGSD